MITKLKNFIRSRFILPQRAGLAFSRGALNATLRNIDSTNPISWEFQAFSQNGEDGIIDYLCSKITHPNRYFLEIGSSNGLENNTAFLAYSRLFSGIMVDANTGGGIHLSNLFSLGVEVVEKFIDKNNIHELLEMCLYKDMDVFCIDIDGNDYYMMKLFLDSGFSPSIIVAEYNSTYGPDKSITIKYRDDFSYSLAHPTMLYYGVSIEAWKRLLSKYGYKFITCDSRGVNAFFVKMDRFKQSFLDNIKGLEYQENFYELRKFKMPYHERFKLIEDMEFVQID